MRRNLFWLNDAQWRQIEPHLPQDVRGKERVDEAHDCPPAKRLIRRTRPAKKLLGDKAYDSED